MDFLFNNYGMVDFKNICKVTSQGTLYVSITSKSFLVGECVQEQGSLAYFSNIVSPSCVCEGKRNRG